MKQEQYPISSKRQADIYEFVSEGTHGRIIKRIEYRPIDESNTIFNLSFVDVDPVTDEISDKVVTNNGDSMKVLATVAVTTLDFTNRHPDALIFATGSTPARTRLYRIGITNNFKEIERYFTVYGLASEGWELFKAGNDYEGFIIKRNQ